MNINTPYRYIWVGLSDAAIEGTFVWNSTAQVTTYSYWLSGQPDNYYNEDYTVLDWPEHGRWVDVSQTYTGAATMCEKSITPTLPSNIIICYYSCLWL